MFLRFLTALFALALASCASTGGGTTEIKNRINTGQTGAIIGGLDSTSERNGVRSPTYITGSLDILNTDTRKVTRYYLDTEQEPTSAKAFNQWLQVKELPVGKYRIMRGQAQRGQTLITLPLLPIWFEEFEIESGHITNIGMLRVDEIRVDTQDRDLTFMERASGQDNENETTYVTYGVTVTPPNVLKSSLEEWADYADMKVVSQPLQIRLSENDFREAVAAASTRDANGSVPTRAEVERKLLTSLKAMLP